jgi:hypothetical protein
VLGDCWGSLYNVLTGQCRENRYDENVALSLVYTLYRLLAAQHVDFGSRTITQHNILPYSRVRRLLAVWRLCDAIRMIGVTSTFTKVGKSMSDAPDAPDGVVHAGPHICRVFFAELQNTCRSPNSKVSDGRSLHVIYIQPDAQPDIQLVIHTIPHTILRRTTSILSATASTLP